MPANTKVTKVFADAASRILDSFLISDEDSPRAARLIITMIENLSQDLDLYELTDSSSFWYDNWIHCALSFLD